MKKYLHSLLLTLTISLTIPLQAAPQADLWDRWEKYNENSSIQVSHDNWSQFLERYIYEKDGIHLLHYSKVTKDDRILLNSYLQYLSEVDVDQLNRKQQLAYWINLYNALTVQTILKNYPVESIRNISSGLFSSGPWDEKLFKVANETLSLNDIEHRILRPIWKDNRLHYAVNCASLGCPNLARKAYTSENTENLLNTGAKEYINHPRGVNIKDNKLIISSIYIWFQEDFGADDKEIIMHLKKYAEKPLAEKLNQFQKINDDDYNWDLNE